MDHGPCTSGAGPNTAGDTRRAKVVVGGDVAALQSWSNAPSLAPTHRPKPTPQRTLQPAPQPTLQPGLASQAADTHTAKCDTNCANRKEGTSCATLFNKCAVEEFTQALDGFDTVGWPPCCDRCSAMPICGGWTHNTETNLCLLWNFEVSRASLVCSCSCSVLQAPCAESC